MKLPTLYAYDNRVFHGPLVLMKEYMPSCYVYSLKYPCGIEYRISLN